MSAAKIQQLGFSSEAVYDVVYKGDTEEPTQLDTEFIYLSEVSDNCARFQCKAELWSPGFVEILGYVDTNGNYRLVKA
jgi:hypothetical protein